VTAKDDLVRHYAEALFRIARAEGELDAVERQVYAFATLLEREPRVREALTDPSLPVENKRNLIAESIGERANPLALSLLGFVVEQGHARELDRIAETLAAVAAGSREHAVAEVRSAVPLTEAQTKKLAAALSGATGRQVELKVVVDESVVGGIVARIGDEIIDGSVRSKLFEAREHLAG
jgi:F-type H+-transporting ATPase subunit delta